ncbi:outer membrane hemin receptor [Bacteroides pyogenes JCM 10003]|nr:outer membrane hemin receptor [Bacteroides pyogenes JCM 10003]
MLSAQMGSEDLLAERIRLGRPVLVDPFTRSITYPRQRVVHETLIGKVKYDTGKWGELFWQGSWQKDKRTENRIRRMNRSDIPAVGLNLKSFQNLIRWNIGYGAWQTEAGGQFMFIDNYSQTGTGVVPIIPITPKHRGACMPYRNFTATAGMPKRAYARTFRKRKQRDTTGRELPTEVRVSSETSLTVSEADIRYPISGRSHRIWGWRGEPLMCTSFTATATNWVRACL